MVDFRRRSFFRTLVGQGLAMANRIEGNEYITIDSLRALPQDQLLQIKPQLFDDVAWTHDKDVICVSNYRGETKLSGLEANIFLYFTYDHTLAEVVTLLNLPEAEEIVALFHRWLELGFFHPHEEFSSGIIQSDMDNEV